MALSKKRKKKRKKIVPGRRKVVQMDVVKDGRKFQRHEMAWQGLGMWEERKITCRSQLYTPCEGRILWASESLYMIVAKL